MCSGAKAVICTFNKSNKPIKFWHFTSPLNLESSSPYGQCFLNANEAELILNYFNSDTKECTQVVIQSSFFGK